MRRIPLTNATFEGANNAYLFADGPETALVDTGDWTDATREQLTAGLAEHGLALADVDRLLLTHWHPDHTGLAGAVQAESGATVHVHAADAPLVAGDESAWAGLRATQERRFAEWGMPEAERAALLDRLDGVADAGAAPTVEPFEHGATFPAGETELRAVHAPGHAAGLCWFEFDADGRRELLSGDALLPVYTPNVGGADVRVERALANYLRALDRIAAAGYDRAWPGHRDPIDDPAARAERVRAHHEERAWRVLDALRRLGPADAWTVSADLFGDLEGIHVLHGPGEAHAHLEHLCAAGTVRETDGRYRLADGVAGAVAAAAADETWPLDAGD